MITFPGIQLNQLDVHPLPLIAQSWQSVFRGRANRLHCSLLVLRALSGQQAMLGIGRTTAMAVTSKLISTLPLGGWLGPTRTLSWEVDSTLLPALNPVLHSASWSKAPTQNSWSQGAFGDSV